MKLHLKDMNKSFNLSKRFERWCKKSQKMTNIQFTTITNLQ